MDNEFLLYDRLKKIQSVMTMSASVLEPIIKKHYESKEGAE